MENRLIQSVIFLGALFFGESGAACTCESSSLERSIEGSEYVFHAFVESAAVDRKNNNGPLIKILVSEIIPYKGGEPTVEYLHTPLSTAICGQAITVGAFYWFFIDANGYFNRCSGTQPANNDAVKPLTVEILEELIRLRKAGKSPFNS